MSVSTGNMCDWNFSVFGSINCMGNCPSVPFSKRKFNIWGTPSAGRESPWILEKNESILNWLAPRNAKEVCRFKGLAGYYRRFMEGFSKIVSPITNLQKKGT